MRSTAHVVKPCILSHSALSCAVATALLMLTAPALAADTLPVAEVANAPGSSGGATQAVPADYEESGTIGDPDSWRSDEFEASWSMAAIGAHHAYARGLTGAGITIGQFDSGVDLAHPELAGRDHVSIDLSDPGCTRDDRGSRIVFDGWFGGCVSSRGDEHTITAEWVFPHGADPYAYAYYGSHGMHVAGTMVATRDGQGMHGVAFGSRLVTARFFGDDAIAWTQLPDGSWDRYNFGSTSTSSTGADVRQLYDALRTHGARALNIEIEYYTTPDTTIDDLRLVYEGDQDFWDALADGAIESDIINVVAAGNSAAVPSLFPGLPVLRPDAERHYLAVGSLALGADGSYDISDFSNRCAYAMNWCVMAPGSEIFSSVIDESVLYWGEFGGSGTEDDPYWFEYDQDQDLDPVHGYADFSGTSMAAPHAIGALALLFERFPYLTSPQVRDVLLTTATDMGAPGVDEIYGWGMIDLGKAIDGPGMLLVDSVVDMDQRAGGVQVWEGEAWDDWANDISGPGRLTKSGVGWLRLSGDNTFAGATIDQGILEFTGSSALAGGLSVVGDGTLLVSDSALLGAPTLAVNGGRADIRGALDAGETTVAGADLLVSGVLSGDLLHLVGGHALVNGTVATAHTLVDAASSLRGSGTLGNTTVHGLIAPDNSAGTLTIAGNYVQAAGSTLQLNLLPSDVNDLIHVTGTATIEGGTLHAIAQPGRYLLGRSYTVFAADGGLSGTFDGLTTQALSPFLRLQLLYRPDGLLIDVLRGTAALAAETYNQQSTASALDVLAADQGLIAPLTQLVPEEAMGAVDQLSGEIHASAQSALLNSGRLVRDVALARARTGHGQFTGLGDAGARPGAWVQVHRQSGHVDADGNAAELQHSTRAALVGIDHEFSAGWRVGALGGIGRTDLDVQHRGSRGDLDTRHLGVYAATELGGFGLRAGYSHAWHEVDIERRVRFTGFSDDVAARYDATSWQLVAEAGYRFGDGTWEVEPYLHYAHVAADSDGFVEDGGPAALRGNGADARVDLSTAGIRFAIGLGGGDGDQARVNLQGNVGYRHAGGDQVYRRSLGWDDSTGFNVRGPAVTDEAVLLELGLSARTSASSRVELGYSGVLSDARDNGVSVRFSWQF